MGEGVDIAQAGDAAGVAQGLLGDGGHVHVFDGGVGDLGGLEQLAQFLQASVGDARDTGARGGGADAGLLMHAGEDGEEGRLACHGQANDRCFHREERFLQGYFHLAEDFFDDALAHVGAALHEGSARIDDDAVGEEGDGQTLHVVGDGVVAAFDERDGLHSAVERLAAARADAERE